MDSNKAREVLQLYRPGTTDALDPQMAEALQLIEGDLELGKWFEEHCAVYLAVRSKLKQIPVPPDLKRKILIENVGRRKIVALRSPQEWFAVAAAFMLLAAGAWYFLKPPSDTRFESFLDREVRQVQRGYAMAMTTTNLDEIRGFLHAKNAPADYVLTKGLEKLPGAGCAASSFYGTQFSMVCFEAGKDKSKPELMYLFVANRSDLTGTPLSRKPQFKRVLKLMSASWTAGNKVYILAGSGNESDLQQYLD